ncbi:MAG: bacterial transcriptional activator domain-containing protein [Fimbriimonadaceae bacterium]|nr:bacterial transcriptional activator domain-containing protein [Fimbriimonadaceae bacterium]
MPTEPWWRSLRRFCAELLEPPPRPPAAGLVVTPDLTRPDPRLGAHVSAARERLYREDLDGAAAAASDALALDPTHGPACFYLGQVRLRQDRLDEARAAFAAAAAGSDPFGLVQSWVDHVDELLRAGPARPVPAAVAVDEPAAPIPVATAPQVGAIDLERAARSALRLGAWQRARELAAEAVALDPTNLLAHHHLGQALLALGDREGALAVYQAARACDTGLGLVDDWLAATARGELLIPVPGTDAAEAGDLSLD